MGIFTLLFSKIPVLVMCNIKCYSGIVYDISFFASINLMGLHKGLSTRPLKWYTFFWWEDTTCFKQIIHGKLATTCINHKYWIWWSISTKSNKSFMGIGENFWEQYDQSMAILWNFDKLLCGSE